MVICLSPQYVIAVVVMTPNHVEKQLTCLQLPNPKI